MPFDIGGFIYSTGSIEADARAGTITNGLVFYLDSGIPESYPFGGTGWFNISGSATSGSLINEPTYSITNGGILTFDGTDDYVNTNFKDNIVSTGFTFSFWFYGTKSTVHFPAAMFVNGDANTIFRIERFSAGNDTIEFGHSPNGGSIDANELISSNFPNNVWTYCTVIYDGNYKYIYKNGALDATSASGQSLTYYSDAALRIGARQDTSLLPFKGDMPIVQMYNRALSATEVLQNFNATRARFNI